MINLRGDNYSATHAPLKQYWFQLDNMPPSGTLSTGQWVSGSSHDVAVTFGDGVNYCLYARVSLKITDLEDGILHRESRESSLQEWVLRDQTPLQEMISGWIGGKERPKTIAVGGML